MLMKEYEPNIAHRRLTMLNSLVTPDLGETTEDISQKWMLWENHIREYEQMIGKAVDEVLELAVVLKAGPQEIRVYLQVNADELTNGYSKLPTILEAMGDGRERDSSHGGGRALCKGSP